MKNKVLVALALAISLALVSSQLLAAEKGAAAAKPAEKAKQGGKAKAEEGKTKLEEGKAKGVAKCEAGKPCCAACCKPLSLKKGEKAKFSTVHEGKSYPFCSEGCKGKFDKSPAKCLKKCKTAAEQGKEKAAEGKDKAGKGTKELKGKTEKK